MMKLRIVVFLLPAFFFAAAFLYHLNTTGVRELVYTLDRHTAMISPLFPARRLQGIQNGQQAVNEDPVYVTVRALRPYERATVQVRVINPRQKQWRIGVAVSHEPNWAYELREPTTDGTASFDLISIPREQNSYRFILSIPGLTSSDGFAVDEIRVTLSGATDTELISRAINLL